MAEGDIAKREPKQAAPPNGLDLDAAPETPPKARYGNFHRPYVIESVSFANRLEVELHYADNELTMVRAHIEALQEREADLIKIRDAALNGLGIIQQQKESEA